MLSKFALGATDLVVSQLCYGTNMLGSAIDQQTSNAILDAFAEQGGNFIDTARMYGDWAPDGPSGASERAVGEWLKTVRREDVIIATKGCGMDLRKGDWQPRVTPADLDKDLGESLAHLQVDAVDLYFLHADNPTVPVGEIIDALDAHRIAGRIRHYAASNWSADRIREANAYAGANDRSGFVASETFWGLAKPNVEAAMQQGYQHYYEGEYEDLHAAGLPIVAYAAQSGGYFTKTAEGADLPEAIAGRYDNPVNRSRLAAAKALADRHGVSINAIVLAYLTSQPHQTIAVFGGRTPAQVRESTSAAGLQLSADELRQLRAD